MYIIQQRAKDTEWADTNIRGFDLTDMLRQLEAASGPTSEKWHSIEVEGTEFTCEWLVYTFRIVSKNVCYYAHSLSLYGTPQEERDLALIKSLGFQVLNPNDPDKRAYYDEQYKIKKMDFFLELVDTCQALCFRSLFDGSIPSGVAKEINRALSKSIPVFELPSSVLRRTLTVEETVEHLKECGQR